ncbi:hypothetical protein PHYPSEUDO_014765 [Phytophthora pseudosyringae]|uniref:Uncharacterized protein n=1 Tax=Phytophthora pseudosyringae TaxID=221518 RepID=A0A8T1V6L1_9STRA|nr:hypothetical protein PHYPSEUDO_014765 [Phytophthora pseudosyringae]
MVASLTPQISYFTTLDQYVFFCFIIACVVAIENALFPLSVGLFPSRESWQEHGLLGFSIGFFTLVNIVWFWTIVGSVKARTRASDALVKVHEAIKVISASIPPQSREAVLLEYLQGVDIPLSDLPNLCCTEFGYLHVRLPVDKTRHAEGGTTKAALHAASREKAERDFGTFKEIYKKHYPNGSLLYVPGPNSEEPLKAAKPNEAFLAGRGERRSSVIAPSSPVGPLRMQSHMTRRRAWSRTSDS